jgi:hypothetical protein
MNVDEQQTVAHGTDPKALVHAAQVLASSDDPLDHRALATAFADEGFLARLDDDGAYQGRINQLRVARVLRTLCKKVDASRAAVLVGLTGSATFLAQDLRIDLLIKACASVRPSPPEIVAFWDAHCQPEDGFGNLTIAALIDNGSPPALELFVTKLLDAAHPEDDRVEWLRQNVLPHRHDVDLVRACRQVLARGLQPPLDLALVQVIFDYRPEEWYRPATVREAPATDGLTGPLVVEMLGLAAQAQGQVALDPRTALVVSDFVRSHTP